MRGYDMIADRVNRIELSPTLKITAKAQAMKAEGIDIVDLSVGEPDFPTPENVKEAAKKAINDNFTKYTANDGIPALKKAIQKKLLEDNSLEYDLNEIIVSCGAKQCLYNLAVALFNKGEEAIIPSPYWVSYPQQVALAKARPVIVQTKEENDFKITPEELRSNLNFNTKTLILNYPSNPTGSTYTREELEAIAEIALEEGIYVISDEIYEKVLYDDLPHYSIASLGKDIREKTIVINGVSKAYSMTGWRIGYAAGPKDLIAAMAKIQSHNTSNAPSVSQMASLEALGGPQFEVSRMAQEFQKRRNYLHQRLLQIPRISCLKPAGAFYLFPNVSSYFNTEYRGMRINNSFGLSYYLLKEAKVAVVPGAAFGNDAFIRISYAAGMEELEEGANRISGALENLKVSRRVKKTRLDNTITRISKRVPIDTEMSTATRNMLIDEVEHNLPYDNYYEWNANINGIIIQLRTNSSHLYNFWVESWYPAQIESDLEPHGIIYAVVELPGKESHAYYNSESKTAILINTSYFGQLKSIALGMVADIGERQFDVHFVHGACIDFHGEGLLMIAPDGTGKSTHIWKLLELEDAMFHSEKWVFLRYRPGLVIADNPERKLYLKTKLAREHPHLMELFDRSKCENVVMSKEDCRDLECQTGDCQLDMGEPYCYWASGRSRAILDPAWLHGPQKYVKRSEIRWVLLFHRDENAPHVEKLEIEEALHYVEQGRYQLSGTDGKSTVEYRSTPFFNPYLLNTSTGRMEIQRRFFEQLFATVPCYRINIAAGTVEETQSRIRDIVGIPSRAGL
jgi:aspartate/methionine/tyrosine aminotransferase